MSSPKPYLSVVIPAYNEAERLPATLERIGTYLGRQPYRSEIVVVDDGSTDATGEVVKAFGTSGEVSEAFGAGGSVHLLSPGHQGKGGAVRSGMLAAAGELILMTDADYCTPIADVEPLIRAIEGGCDVAIGSRAVAGSVLEVRQPLYREWLGRAGNLLIQAMLLPGIHDTQCGFKLFRRQAAREIFSRSVMDGISFDVEVLFLARRLGWAIREVPIHWSHIPGSKIRIARDARSMLRDLLRIRRMHGKIVPAAQASRR